MSEYEITIGVVKDGWRDFTEHQIRRKVPGTDLVMYPEIVAERDEDDWVVAHLPYEVLPALEATEEELWAEAEKTCRETAACMSFNEATGIDFPGTEDLPFLVLTNRLKSFGAGVITCPSVLEEARKRLMCDAIYILPSSIHEVLAVPADIGSGFELAEIVRSVNDEVVSPGEQVSDHPYLYDGTLKVVE